MARAPTTAPSTVATAVPASTPSSVGQPQVRTARPVTYAAEPRKAAWPKERSPV